MKRSVKRFASVALIGVVGFSTLLQTGCRDDAPPPPRVPVPSSSNRDAVREGDYVKPLPPEDWRQARPPAPSAQP